MRGKAKGTLNRIAFERYFFGKCHEANESHPAKSLCKSLLISFWIFHLVGRLAHTVAPVFSEQRGGK